MPDDQSHADCNQTPILLRKDQVDKIIAEYIRPLVDLYVKLTGYPVGLFVNNQSHFPHESLESFTLYCKMIRADKRGQKCCDADHLTRARGNEGLAMCHAGLWNYTRPLFVGGQRIATILYGQKRLSDPTRSQQTLKGFETVAHMLQLTPVQTVELRRLLDEVAQVQTKQLEPSDMRALVDYEQRVLALVVDKLKLEEEKCALDISTQNVVHEINTYLEGMAGSVDYIRDHHAAGNNDLTRSIRVFKSNILRFKILAAKFGASIGDYVYKRASMAAIVSETVDFYKKKAANKAISLHVTGEFPDIIMSREHIQHCLFNLVENAIKYSFHGYHSPRSIDVMGLATPSFCQVTIENYGIGFDPDEAQRIFEPKYQSRRRQGEKRDGSGLGLAIVKTIVENHLGLIWADSRKTEGPAYVTTFRLLLPVKHTTNDYIETQRKERG